MREGPLSFSPAEWHLLEAVLSAPEDDAPRLVLADALQARGEAFGEFIALQVALAAAQVNWETWAWNSAGGARGLREKMLPAMLDEVLAGTRTAGVPLEIIRQRRRLCDVEPSLRRWAEFFVPGATDVGWQRGFPHEVTVPARALLEAQATLTPLRKLEVTDGDELDPVTLVAHLGRAREFARPVREPVRAGGARVSPRASAAGAHPVDLGRGRGGAPHRRPLGAGPQTGAAPRVAGRSLERR